MSFVFVEPSQELCYLDSMSDLTARINRKTKTATFFGPGTFQAKESIKQLGPARWMREEKVWRIKPFELSDEELLRNLPNITIEEEGLVDEKEIIAPLSEVENTSIPAGLPESLSVSPIACESSLCS